MRRIVTHEQMNEASVAQTERLIIVPDYLKTLNSSSVQEKPISYNCYRSIMTLIPVSSKLKECIFKISLVKIVLFWLCIVQSPKKVGNRLQRTKHVSDKIDCYYVSAKFSPSLTS